MDTWGFRKTKKIPNWIRSAQCSTRIRAIRSIPWFLANDLVFIEHEQQILNAKKTLYMNFVNVKVKRFSFLWKNIGGTTLPLDLYPLGIFFGREKREEPLARTGWSVGLVSSKPLRELPKRPQKAPTPRLSKASILHPPGFWKSNGEKFVVVSCPLFVFPGRTVLKGGEDLVYANIMNMCGVPILQKIRGYIITVNKWINNCSRRVFVLCAHHRYCISK